MNEQVFMATRERAAALAEVAPARLDYWGTTGLVRPSVNDRLTPGRVTRLYNFAELLSLLIVAQMRKRNVSLQHIRAVVERVRSRGREMPLTEVRYAIVGRRLYFQDDQGEWEDGNHPGQGVLPHVLELEPLRARIADASRRPDSARGQIERRRGSLGSRPVLSGTRIPVDTVIRYLDAGATPDQVIEEFPALSIEDVEAARLYAV